MIVASCSVEKNTSLSRNYHHLVSHYNIYFNGEESYKKGIEKARSSVMNDYNQVLPIFLFGDEAVNQAVSADMKRAIDKATKVITFHSITAKPRVKEGDQSPRDKAFFEKKEYNKWVDDSYLLMGRAYMYQGEYFMAAETFKHILVTFPQEPVRYLAMTWLVRAYIMIGEMREAERILVSLADATDFPEDYLKEYYTTRAHFHMEREEYGKAAENLAASLEQKGVDKEERIRYTYILAQLYEEAGENELALENYRQVTRFNPPYEMAFNARVSMAEVFESGGAGSADLRKLLTKMLRDSKNKEYLDQIYFALGNISFEEGEMEKAIEYYQLSVSTSLQNRYQKGYSSLTLAKIYYEEPDYKLSAAYYDSAVSFLDRDYPGYEGLSTLSASLSELVYHIQTYELEDSLQMLAQLPEEQRLRIIDGIIDEVRQQEEEVRLAEQQARQDMAFNQSMMYNNPGSTGGGSGGKWYFYNLNAKSFGQPEFRMKWGERRLEDHWRRKNKQTVSEPSAGTVAEGDSVNGGAQIFDNKSREFYLANIPLTDSAMEQSHIRLENALFNAGAIYREKLLDYEESAKVFKELLATYPDSEYRPAVLYYLYDLSNITQNTGDANRYRSELVSGHPETHYAKLLNNPNYIQELEAEEQKVVRYYENVYEKYGNKEYASVIEDATRGIEQFPGDPLVPKFKYIRALAVGAMEGKEPMKTELDSLIAHHPGAEESRAAQEIIDYMYVAFPVIREADQAREAEAIYTGYDAGQEHLFLVALRTGENINQVSFDLLNYNLDHFNQYDLQIDRLAVQDGYNILVVRSFINADGASRYREIIRENVDRILAGIPADNYRIMIISVENYRILTEEKEVNPYYQFYRRHYMGENTEPGLNEASAEVLNEQ